MRQAPFKGWAVFSRSSKNEWPMITTVRATRRDAIAAWKAEMKQYRVADPDGMLRQRVSDGSIRVGKVIVSSWEG